MDWGTYCERIRKLLLQINFHFNVKKQYCPYHLLIRAKSLLLLEVMETTSVHLSSEDDCWNLFKNIAFMEGLEDADLELVEIGRDIVKKCDGVPLAAETLGGLCYRSNKQMWELVRDSHIWKFPEDQNGILRALKISYHHLPFYLKLCFAYCSLFPKGYRIQKDTLIQLWIAQELIHFSEENQSLDDIGSEYVEVLIQISFFQKLKVDHCGKVIEFEMHDLTHDLAQSMSGVECFTVCKDNEENYHERVRHLFFNIERPHSPFEIPGVIAKPSNIQTLIFAFNIDFSLDAICLSLKLLRVLEFKNDEMDEFPDSIDRLKQLRYLKIQCPKIKKLPESITNLRNLQVLKLECEGLEKLPSGIQNMISLRHIRIEGCKNCEGLPCFSELPFLKILILCEMDRLEYVEDDRPHLQSGKEWFSSLTTLEINGCPNLESWFAAVEAQPQQQELISFPSLDELSILNCPKLKSVPRLLSSSGIKKVILIGTTGEVVESSVGVSNPTNSSSLFTSLEVLLIIGCSGMESWPNWLVGSHLPSLRSLEIGCTSSLPFLPQQIQHLPVLENLGISEYCEEALPEWMANITSSSLGRLRLYFCPNLKILPEWVLRDNTAVHSLEIFLCPHLEHRYNKETGEDGHKIDHIRSTIFT